MTSPFRRRVLGAASGLALGAGLLVGPAALPAASAEIPSFSFADCPKLPEGAVPEFWLCTVAITTGGKMQLGKLDQPISKPITITYANGFDPVTLEEQVIFGGMRAERMLVQRGIFGDPLITAVYAQPRYAGDFALEGGRIKLALKMNVQNPALGSSCHIGTNSNPIKLELTTGTTSPPAPNTPISGKPPEMVSTDPPVLKTTVVDNAFAVPKASYCGLAGTLNWAINLQAGLPSAAGRNTAIFDQYVRNKPYTEMAS
ncbi:hypothetical protein ACQEU3_10910 [Spirillospora sp. CA-253888]